MSTNPYIQYFKDHAAGKIPKNQKFYIVDQRDGVKANDVIEGPRPLASKSRRHRKTVRPQQSKSKKRNSKKRPTKGTQPTNYRKRISIFD
jgi:hypothetical protein